MWSEVQSNGKIKYVERYEDPLTLKQKKLSITLEGKDTAANRKKAQASLQERIIAAIGPSSNNITLGQLCTRYLEFQSKTVKASTLERNKRTLNKLVKKFGTDSIVDKLTVSYITDKLLEMDCTNVTRNEYIKRFKAMLVWGEKMDLHENSRLVNKLTLFKEETTKKERIQDKYLEPEEAKKLLQYMADSNSWRWYHLTNILLLSGMRIGEAIALNSSDVDNTSIHVTKTYDHINRIVTTPKTMTSNRDIFIQEELDDAIKLYKLWRKEYNFSNGIKTKLFFSDNNGDYINYFSYEKYLRELSHKLIGRTITAHALRHTHVSLMAASGVSVETISRRVGHDNSRVTKDIYLHVTKSVIESDNEAIKKKKIL